MKRLLRFWLPPALWVAAIFIFSSYPTAPVSTIYWREFVIKKSAHIIEFGILTILLYRGFRNYNVGKGNAAIFSIFISLIYGVFDEFHQSFTPGREPRVRDVVFDTIGALLAIYSLWNLLPKAPAKLKSWAKRLQLI